MSSNLTFVPRSATAPRDDDPVVYAASFLPSSYANGPGCRAVLWLQGCDLRCPGCYNPDFLPMKRGTMIHASEIVRVVSALPGIEGITFSGGEPMLQADALSAIAAALQDQGLTVTCFTGRQIEELRATGDDDVERFLEQVDLLIDGPYERHAGPGGLWRGSANQRLLPLTGVYRSLCDAIAASEERSAATSGGGSGAIGDRPSNPVEVRIGRGYADWTGVLPLDIVRGVTERMRGLGSGGHGRTLPPGRSSQSQTNVATSECRR